MKQNKLLGKMAEKNITTKDIAKLLNKTTSAIYAKNNGIIRYDIQEALKVAKLLNESVENIFEEEEENVKKQD